MASDWTTTIDVAVTEGYVSYIATGVDPDAHGVAEISGEASFYRVSFESERGPSRQEFQVSLVIQGRPVSEVKNEASVWPDLMNEITDDVIGILFKPDEFALRRGYLYLHPAQFDKLIGNLTTGMKVRFYSRQGVQSECDLITRVDAITKKIGPSS